MSQLCPYPGLRPFNEEESIFFKGREEHIDKIINQLQEKHFLMITGASGDGKSSLVYAGLIPRARAGFFKAKYNNWLITDFRPERSPLSNLATALGVNMHRQDFTSIEEELSYGFSSLIELYKASPHFIDYESDKYKNSNEEEKLVLKNKSANILILVDQFEEMFTNSENLNRGKPSLQAITLINLLIETAKIAENQGIPIYIVCTMRSDYVGDCAVFRGLPEQIVYSQFFVPRLKRQEIHRAILEPAKLSGNKISNRLIERLINDLSDGQDQLPILQHALNRIWRMHKDEEATEMDLIHYAKVGGISPDLLAENEKVQFTQWLSKQASYKKEILLNASLSNVLSAHARELYFKAPDYCSEYTGRKIEKEAAYALVKKTLTCLTKYNDNRAVRNRASVEEIINIIGDPQVDKKMIEGAINLFRLPENTLLQPFASNNDSSLQEKSILDITHESLIRNWPELLEWTKEESENIQVLQDFKKQLTRWEESNMSKGYLLPPGSLNYFQSWYQTFQPNAYSILKYDSRNLEGATKLNDSKKFIESSANYLQESESAIKTKRRITRIVAATIIIVLLSFTTWALSERNKAVTQQELAMQKTKEANKSKEEAFSLKDEALKAKENAIKNEQLALEAKSQAEVSKRMAERSSMEALRNLQSAKENALLAKTETEKANSALVESEKSRAVAETAKTAAEKAEKKSAELSYISLAQNIAIKSGLRSDDAEIQALLAMQAFLFTSDNKGEVQDPAIFEALRNAQKSFLKQGVNASMQTSLEQRDIQFSADKKTLISADKSGTISKWNPATEKLIDKCALNPVSAIEALTVTNWPNACITAHEDNSVVLWNIADFKKPFAQLTLHNHKGPVRKILCVPSKVNYFITAGKDSTIAINQINNVNSVTPAEKIKTTFYTKDMVLDAASNNVLVLAENGAVYWINLTDKKLNRIMEAYSGLGATASAIGFDEKNNSFVVGYQDGKIKVFSAETVYRNVAVVKHTYAENKASIEKICFNDDGNLMCVTSADKEVKIFDLTKKDIKPIAIRDMKSKTRACMFNEKNQIILAMADHTIRVIETSSEKIADKFCSALKRNLSDAEWQQNIGKDVPYQKTCKNLK